MPVVVMVAELDVVDCAVWVVGIDDVVGVLTGVVVVGTVDSESH